MNVTYDKDGIVIGELLMPSIPFLNFVFVLFTSVKIYRVVQYI